MKPAIAALLLIISLACPVEARRCCCVRCPAERHPEQILPTPTVEGERQISGLKYEVYQSRDSYYDVAKKRREYKWRWRLKAANGRIIADSGQAYLAKIDCVAGLNLVKQSASADVLTLPRQ